MNIVKVYSRNTRLQKHCLSKPTNFLQILKIREIDKEFGLGMYTGSKE